MQLRQLTPDDGPMLERFLLAHRDSSAFLRLNARRGGLAYHGEPYQAVYPAAFEDEWITAVVAHCWNGSLLVQALCLDDASIRFDSNETFAPRQED
jgi:hypothetical protein